MDLIDETMENAPSQPIPDPADNGNQVQDENDFFGGAYGEYENTTAAVPETLEPHGMPFMEPAVTQADVPQTDVNTSQTFEIPDAHITANSDNMPQTELMADEFSMPVENYQSAGMDGYSNAEAPIMPPAPEDEDPRVAWRKKNQKDLAEKDKEEAERKREFVDKAAEQLKKTVEMRNQTLEARRKENRAMNHSQPEKGSSMEGTTWQKVHKLVNWNAGTHSRDVGRFKSVLTNLKVAT